MARQTLMVLALLIPILPAMAALPKAEIERAVGAPQALGAAHTLRQIPEACARLEGVFTDQAAAPYKFTAVRTSNHCQPRARFVDFDKAAPSVAAGWKLNEIIRVPSAECASQQAHVQVWRKPAGAAPPRDGQGQSRIYLEEARQRAAAGSIAAVPMYAANVELQGNPCR